MKKPQQAGFATRAIHYGQEPDPLTGAVTVPIYATSTYVQQGIGENKGYEYSRVSNPTRTRLEENLASLESGVAARVYASGMAAIHAIASMLKSGDHVICGNDLYGGTPRLFNQVMTDFGLEFSYMDTSEAENVERAIRKNTRMVYVETPTNPLMRLSDLAAISRFAGARKSSWWSTTLSCRPIFSSRWRWARTWWCTRPPSFSTGTAMGWAAWWCAARRSRRRSWRFCRKPRGRYCLRLNAGWCCAA